VKDLFQLLASNEGKTPDQIVAALNMQGWIHFKYLTQEQANELHDKRMVLVEWIPGTRRFTINQSSARNWSFWGRSDVDYFNDTLQNYWGILTEEYVDGDLPDPPA